MATIKEWKAAKIRLDNARIKLSSAWATLELKAASFRGLSHLKPGSLLIDDGIYHHVDHAPALPTWPTEKELIKSLANSKTHSTLKTSFTEVCLPKITRTWNANEAARGVLILAECASARLALRRIWKALPPRYRR